MRLIAKGILLGYGKLQKGEFHHAMERTFDRRTSGVSPDQVPQGQDSMNGDAMQNRAGGNRTLTTSPVRGF